MTTYYAAAPDRIATSPIEGGIEITSQQYQDALAVLTDPADKRIIATDGGAFALVDPPEPDPEPEPEPQPVDLYAYAEQKRWEAETSGIVVAGFPVATDDRSKVMIIGARLAADADPGWSTQWVAADGSVHQIDAAAMVAISDAVQAHVNACFTTYAAVKSDIDAGDITTTQEIDAAFAA